MSHQLGRVVSEILLRYYGEIVQQVGNDLFTYGSKTTTMIMRSTGLPRSQVICQCFWGYVDMHVARFNIFYINLYKRLHTRISLTFRRKWAQITSWIFRICNKILHYDHTYLFQVIESLRTLVKYDLASFEPSANEVIADYKLIPDNVLLLIRYPR